MNVHVSRQMTDTAPDFLAGGGEMGAAMRAHDWAATVLGPTRHWPQTLRTCLRIMLASRQPMWVWWGPDLVNFYNDACLPIIGGRHPGALGQPAREVWADIWDRIEDRAAAAMMGQSSHAEAGMPVMGRDGRPQETYCTFSFSPVPQEDGSIGGIICTKSADSPALESEHRRRSERQQNLLLDELNHRVKNTLATIQAMAMQTLRGVDAPARDTFLARLFALSSQHDLLTSDNWEGASLEGVVRRALRPWRDEGHIRFAAEGPAVHLDPKRALALGMGFHELATNAARYGALSNDTGCVHVRWTIAPDGNSARLRWEERGGPAVTAPQRRGFGLRLIEHGLARELSGVVRLDFPAEGLVCEWTMKLRDA